MGFLIFSRKKLIPAKNGNLLKVVKWKFSGLAFRDEKSISTIFFNYPPLFC